MKSSRDSLICFFFPNLHNNLVHNPQLPLQCKLISIGGWRRQFIPLHCYNLILVSHAYWTGRLRACLSVTLTTDEFCSPRRWIWSSHADLTAGKIIQTHKQTQVLRTRYPVCSYKIGPIDTFLLILAHEHHFKRKTKNFLLKNSWFEFQVVWPVTTLRKLIRTFSLLRDLWWEKWHGDMFSCEYFSFLHSVLFEEYSIFIFFNILLLQEGKTGKSWEP